VGERATGWSGGQPPGASPGAAILAQTRAELYPSRLEATSATGTAPPRCERLTFATGRSSNWAGKLSAHRFTLVIAPPAERRLWTADTIRGEWAERGRDRGAGSHAELAGQTHLKRMRGSGGQQAGREQAREVDRLLKKCSKLWRPILRMLSKSCVG